MHFMTPNLLGGATGSVTSCVSQLRPGGTLVAETPSGTDASFIKNYPPNIHHHQKRPESTVDLSTADFSKYDTIPATALTVLGKPKQAPGGKAPWFLHSNQQCKVSKCDCPLKQRLTTNVGLINTAISQSNTYFFIEDRLLSVSNVMHATVSLIWSCLPAENVHNLQVYCNGRVKNDRNMFRTVLSYSAPHWWLEHLSQWIYNISQIKNNVTHHWFPPAGSSWYSELVKEDLREQQKCTQILCQVML